MKSAIKHIVAAGAVAMLSACGGGSSGGGSSGGSGVSSSIFQYGQANTFSGWTFVGLGINDNTLGTSQAGCGISSPTNDQATVEARLISLGGTVLTSTPTKWCGTASGQTGCLIQTDKVYVVDNRTAQSTDIEIYMPGLVVDRMTVVEYNTLNSNATIVSRMKDSTRTNNLNCPAMVTQSVNAIDGNWSGYKATYDTNAKTATSTTVSISCTQQICTLSDAPSSPIILRQLQNGTWITNANAPKYAGASVSDDQQLLSVFVCNAPLIESQALANCGFYTFKR